MKTFRELINLIESAQTPVAEDLIDHNAPEPLAKHFAELYYNGLSSADEAKMAARIYQQVVDGEMSIEQLKQHIAKLEKEQGVAEGEDDDVEHLANTFADLYWSGKIGMTSATEKVKMAHKIIQAVEDGRLSIEELKQDIRDLDKPGVAEATPRHFGPKGAGTELARQIRANGELDRNKQPKPTGIPKKNEFNITEPKAKIQVKKDKGVAEAISQKDLISRLQKDLPRIDDPKNKDAEPVKWTGPKKGDYGHTGYQGHGMPTDKAERDRIRADKKKAQGK